MSKTKHMNRWLLRNPWIRPLIAFNLAAIKIQKCFRGHFQRQVMRKKIKPRRKLRAKSQLNKYLGFMDKCKSGLIRSPPWMEDGYSVWCVVKIQAWYRMIRHSYNHRLKRHVVNQIAAIVIQTSWKNSNIWLAILMRMKAQYAPERFDIDVEATRIQRSFRAYCNKRVFKYLKELILVKFKGAPADLLRCIVPGEVDLFDKAAGVHVRFRLGGAIFPPKILFKVFTHRALCDVNAFAPRAYCMEKPMDTFQLHNHQTQDTSAGAAIDSRRHIHRPLRVGGRYFDTILTTNTSNGEGWYRRDDRNQWRPIATQVIDDDYVPQWLKDTLKEKPPMPYHFSRLKRQEDVDARKKRRRREWVMKAYRMAAGDDILEEYREKRDDCNQDQMQNRRLEHPLDGGGEGSVHTAGSSSSRRMSDKYRDNFGMCNTANSVRRRERHRRHGGGGGGGGGGRAKSPIPIAVSLEQEPQMTEREEWERSGQNGGGKWNSINKDNSPHGRSSKRYGGAYVDAGDARYSPQVEDDPAGYVYRSPSKREAVQSLSCDDARGMFVPRDRDNGSGGGHHRGQSKKHLSSSSSDAGLLGNGHGQDGDKRANGNDLRYLPTVYQKDDKHQTTRNHHSRSLFAAGGVGGMKNKSRSSRDMEAYRRAVAKAEEEDIVKWGMALDFDDYANQWAGLAASLPSDFNYTK